MLRAAGKQAVHRQGLPAAGRGFALVLAVVLMGLVLLLTVSLSALSRVELAALSPQRSSLLARENARLGLMQAIGELQRQAGPDRRVTARAEILGSGAAAENLFWTGVWDSTQPGQEPVWLVSGAAPNPTAAARDSVVLVPGNPSVGAPPVRVEKVYFDRGDGARNAFAWWVGDEGVKASLAAGRERPTGLDELEEIALANQTPAGLDLSGLLTNGRVMDAVLEADLKKLASRQALPLLRNADGPAVTKQRAQAGFHDYTPCAYAVLENPATGGLKHNLSDDGYLDGFVNDALQQFLTPVTDEQPQADLSEQDPEDGEPVHALYPIPTEVVLYMGLFHAWRDGIIRIRYHVEVEFWNPYSVPIYFSGESDEETGLKNRAIVVYFENMPEIEVEDRSSGRPPDLEDDLDNFMSYEKGDNRRYLNGWMDISPLEQERGAPVLMPGEVYRVLAPDPLQQPRGVARNFCFRKEPMQGSTDGIRWSAGEPRDARPDYNDRIRVKVKHPRKGVKIGFVAFSGSQTDYREEEPFFEIRNLDYDNFDYEQVFRSKHRPRVDSYQQAEFEQTLEDGILPFSNPYWNMDYYNIGLYTIAYHYKLTGDAEELAELLGSLDPRNPVLDADESFTDKAGEKHKVADYLEVKNFHRTDPEEDLDAFDPDDLFHDPEGRIHVGEKGPPRQVVMFDLPLSEPVSVGVLRFAQISGLSALAIGNPQGGSFNGVFDHYFMSPLAAASTGSARRLLNPWVEPLDRRQWQRELATTGTPRQDDAARLSQVGAFNLNSTSVEAWQAVLGASRFTPAAPAEGAWNLAGDSSSTPPVFYRLPFYGAWIDKPVGGREDAFNIEKAYNRAGRSLSAEAGEAQLYYLSQGLVEKIKQHGPFKTVADFANAGILQQAIDEVGVTRGVSLPPINADVPAVSNLYLSQGDVLEGLAPFVTVRSDTFIIRACGEAIDPLSGETTRAWCEATVRRTPEQADGSDPMEPTVAGGLGRRFELVAFRWLDASEVEGEDVPLSL